MKLDVYSTLLPRVLLSSDDRLENHTVYAYTRVALGITTMNWRGNTKKWDVLVLSHLVLDINTDNNTAQAFRVGLGETEIHLTFYFKTCMSELGR